MVFLGKNGSSANLGKQTALFDIRIQGVDRDVLVIKGSPSDANSVLLSGTIVLSVLEPMHIKRLSLKLYSTLRLKWTNKFETQRGTIIKRPYRYEKRIFEHDWDNFEIQNYFSNLYDNYNANSPMMASTSANSSSSSLKSIGAKKSKSVSNLVSFSSSASLNQQSHLLVQGNYEFPFSAILPGSTLESVEGLPGANVVYKLQATIERGRFSNDLVAKKHLRIVRTLTPDAVELSETMAVDNTWPKKVEYTISVPQRAIAIGSSIPISMTLVPLAKGLKLGNIKITLVEFFSCSGSVGPPHQGDRPIVEFKPAESEKDLNEDRWEINTHVQVPPSLTRCTQDVDILTNIKVRHKLKFNIGLINPDGHTSELRASLPIILFISPFVALGVKNYDRKDSVADNSMSAFAEIPSDGENQDYGDDDEVIFAPDPDFTPAMATAANMNHNSEIEREAPPNYGNHIYDRLWNEIRIDDTPDASHSQTPDTQTPDGAQNAEALNVNKLSETLKRLRLQRLNEQSQLSLDSVTSQTLPGSSCESRAAFSGFTIGGDDEDDEEEHDGISFQAKVYSRPPETPVNIINDTDHDYFSINPSQATAGSPPHGGFLMSPGYTPGYNHISRVNSESNLSSSLPTSRDWNSTNLHQVPSYQVAMKSPMLDDFSPAYEPPDELALPKSIHFKSSSLNNSREQSTAYLSNLRGGDIHDNSLRSKASSNSSSPTMSRNPSSTNINNGASNNTTSKSPMKPKFLSTSNPSLSGFTPLLSSPPVRLGNNSTETTSSTGRVHLSNMSNHSRSSSFVNLMGNIMHKKDKSQR